MIRGCILSVHGKVERVEMNADRTFELSVYTHVESVGRQRLQSAASDRKFLVIEDILNDCGNDDSEPIL